MDATDQPAADDLAALIAAINELLSELDMSHDDLNLAQISYDTAIVEDRIRAILNGAPSRIEDPDETFARRLVFLHETRLKPDRKKYTHDEIGSGTGLSHGQVGYLLKGQRRPGFNTLRSLQKFFSVGPGFFAATESQSLKPELQERYESLTRLALLKGKGISLIALRRSGTTAPGRLSDELSAALEMALRKDPEVHALTESIVALPAHRRRRIIPLLKNMLGLIQSEEPPDGKSP